MAIKGFPNNQSAMIKLKSPLEIGKLQVANQIVAEALAEMAAIIQPGLETLELDILAEEICRRRKVKPAFKNYRGYPRSVCVSINDEVVHGIPSHRCLEEGDLVSIDFGVRYDGYFGDAAVTVPVGEVSSSAKKLMATTEEALYAGIGQVCIGHRLSDVSHAIQETVEKEGFSVIRDFVGHGIGRALHEDPQIPNYGPPGHGPVLQAGMTMAIEPMVSAGDWQVSVLPDGWTAVTKDGSLAAHYEHTIALTEKGVLILSKL
ncbi:methionine aminopeptidase, type I [Desulfobacca acetoxidans DSM 11109]|uniref:Methionine aminopeptidase n=2 Tax=Desulfobacca acetoxidans TaxID=60893 RepID=F2NJB7_DESAR|nr:type I methionyl aminopeptidase [Desulfobacca acetoxidans]AEB09289.1 methionine aminopeptidase, type I [Desulfobacca acetoxidans DSM 11109]